MTINPDREGYIRKIPAKSENIHDGSDAVGREGPRFCALPGSDHVRGYTCFSYNRYKHSGTSIPDTLKGYTENADSAHCQPGRGAGDTGGDER
jgi:hypothetical protein